MGPKYVDPEPVANLSKVPMEKLEKELLDDYDKQVKKAKAKGLEPAPFTLMPKGKLIPKVLSPKRANASLLKDAKEQKLSASNQNTPSYTKPFGNRSTRGSVGFKNTTKLKQYSKLDSKYSTLDQKEDSHKIQKFKEIVSQKEANNENSNQKLDLILQ